MINDDMLIQIMKQDVQTAHDIFQRNNHSNPFHIKIPSHNASKQSIDLLVHAFVLNKNQKMAQMYKLSLQYLIQSKDNCKSEEFVDNLLQHLQNWQVNMGNFGSWPHTRASFYYLQDKLKSNEKLQEKVITKRAILEPNKQQFINKSQNLEFKSESLKLIKKINDKGYQIHKQPQLFDLPRDLLLLDSSQCWQFFKQKYSTNHLHQKKVMEYLKQYQNRGVVGFISKNYMKLGKKQTIKGLKLRQSAFSLVMGEQSQKIAKVIDNLQKSQAN